MSYVRGKYALAAVDLITYLREQGITAGPVAQPSKRNPILTVYEMPEDQIKLLPAEFAGFKVIGRSYQPGYGNSAKTGTRD